MGKKRIKTIKADKLKFSKNNKKRVKIFLPKARAYIRSSYNNTMVSLTDLEGNVVAWSSSGKLGFRGAKKATPYAASLIIRDILEKVKTVGLKEIEVFVKGVGPGRDSAIREIVRQRLSISLIKDITPIPHGGCRPPKPRRV